MSDVHVKYADDAAGFANKLLAAARKLELPTSVVQFSPDGHYAVPEDVAEEAGVSYDVQESPETTEVPADPIAEADPPKSIDPEVPVEPGEEPNSEGKTESEPSTAGVEAPEEPEPELKGKALDEALVKAGLSKSGNKAEKLARLAEHQNKE